MKTHAVKPALGVLLSCCLLVAIGCQQQPSQSVPPKILGIAHLLDDRELQSLGEKIFFDSDLSTPPGQSCAACHGPEVGWTGPDEGLNKAGTVYPGAMHSRFGNRKPNSAAYATLTPTFHAVRKGSDIVFVGGDFWDGRATGWKLGNPAADQAQGPFLNPVEQNNPDAKSILSRICQSAYGPEFRSVASRLWGIDDVCSANTDFAYGIVALAIAAYENSPAVNQFSSKFDLHLAGKTPLTEKELKGLELFEGKAKCAGCHTSRPGPNGEPPLFTDFTYDNIGMPRNPENPWYKMPMPFNPDGDRWVDPGLAGFLKEVPQYAMFAEANLGKHRVPSLRNVDLRPTPTFVKAFGHNGYFKSLEVIVHFYNTRDVLPGVDKVADPKSGVNRWPAPEVAQNMNTTELGNLGLTAEEESAVVAFLKTLSDGYKTK
jgi:cytochrome c peroxidase